MAQRWLGPNYRVMMLGMAVPAGLFCVGLLLAIGWPWHHPVLRGLGGTLACITAVVLGVLAYLAFLPRLSYEDGHLLVYLRSTVPIRVPIDVVECFFLGQETSQIPSRRGASFETATVVVRLAESAVQWHHKEVKPTLGHWCDGYITIRGTWCEHLNRERVNRLNRCLSEVLSERHRHDT